MTAEAVMDAFVDRARLVSCLDIAERRGWKLRRAGHEWTGPCPVCGGRDRFSINTQKNVFNCRRSGHGGDAIALVRYADGLDFHDACGEVLGEPVPGRTEKPDVEKIARRRAAQEKAAREARERQELEASRFREEARVKAWKAWQRAVSGVGTEAEAYMAGRGVRMPPTFRYMASASYWHTPMTEDGKAGDPLVIYCGPAMVAPIVRPDGRFGGVHLTWFDPDRSGEKARILDPKTGEPLPAKKVKGVQKGGAIRLVTPPNPVRLVSGEGIETTLSVADSEADAGTAYWALVSLGNIGGRAATREKHPTLTVTDSIGRVRPQRYAGPEPDMDDREAFVPPDWCRDWLLLGDGDSERLATEACLKRGARRAMRLRPRLKAEIAFAPDGLDFNNLLRCGA